MYVTTAGSGSGPGMGCRQLSWEVTKSKKIGAVDIDRDGKMGDGKMGDGRWEIERRENERRKMILSKNYEFGFFSGEVCVCLVIIMGMANLVHLDLE